MPQPDDQTNPIASVFASPTAQRNLDVTTDDDMDVDSSSLWSMLFDTSLDNVTRSLLNASAFDGGPDAVDANATNNLPYDIHIDEACVGVAEYCNLTHEEYEAMLFAYIYPTWTEWVLIGAHGVVFTMGLVRVRGERFCIRSEKFIGVGGFVFSLSTYPSVS